LKSPACLFAASNIRQLSENAWTQQAAHPMFVNAHSLALCARRALLKTQRAAKENNVKIQYFVAFATIFGLTSKYKIS
jgi:hypothetical protein